MSKRVYVTIAWTLLPTLAWLFIAQDHPFGEWWSRAIWFYLTGFIAIGAYFYPGWDE